MSVQTYQVIELSTLRVVGTDLPYSYAKYICDVKDFAQNGTHIVKRMPVVDGFALDSIAARLTRKLELAA